MASSSHFSTSRMSVCIQDKIEKEDLSKGIVKTSRSASAPSHSYKEGQKTSPLLLGDLDIFSAKLSCYIEGSNKKPPLGPVLHALRHQKNGEEISPFTLFPKRETLKGRVEKLKVKKTNVVPLTERKELSSIEDLLLDSFENTEKTLKRVAMSCSDQAFEKIADLSSFSEEHAKGEEVLHERKTFV